MAEVADASRKGWILCLTDYRVALVLSVGQYVSYGPSRDCMEVVSIETDGWSGGALVTLKPPYA